MKEFILDHFKGFITVGGVVIVYALGMATLVGLLGLAFSMI